MIKVLFKPCTKRLSKVSRAALFVVLLLLPATSLAQGYFRTVSGELTDPTGAVIQGAKVILTDQEKGFTFTATSDSAGHYLFAAVPPGLYTVTVEMQGFQKAERTNVKVNVSENASANLQLEVATATQSIQVEAQAQTLATEDAVTGQVVNRRFINDLPLVDRNGRRSEEHTSELQSQSNLVCRLLLEKKKKK